MRLVQRIDVVDRVTTGRYMFGLAVLGWAALHFIYGEFAIGRAPAWPAGVPGREAWAYLSGLFLVVAGMAVLTGNRGRQAMIITAVMIFAWALVRQVASLIADPELGGRLTMVGKALTFFGGALAVAGTLPEIAAKSPKISTLINQSGNFILLGRYCLGTFMILCGVQHFLFYQFVQTLVPSWIPGALFWTYFAGLALIAGGLGLMINRIAPLAAILSGIMVFIWFVILHIPRAIEMNSANEWTAVVESFAVSGLAFLLSTRALHRRKIQ